MDVSARTGGIYGEVKDENGDDWETREEMNDDVDEVLLTEPSVTADVPYMMVPSKMTVRLSKSWKLAEETSLEEN